MADSSATRAEQYLAPQTLGQLTPFELRAKMIVEGVMSGMHRSPYQGMAVEFAQHRQYVPGDDLKHLDWKVYGRSDKLYIKQYQQETNLDVVLLIDASASMNYGTLKIKPGWGGTEASRAKRVWTKFDQATAAAVAMAYLCLHQRDRVGVITFADEVRHFVKRSNAQGQWRRIVNSLATQPVEAETNIGKVAEQVLSKVTNRALFFLISDVFDDAEAVRQALARFRHRRHDVVVMQTLDRQETEFDFSEVGVFEGLENEGRLRVDPRALRDAYLDAMHGHIDRIHDVTRSFGFDHLVVDSHDSIGPALSYMLARRNSHLKQAKVG